MFNEGLSFLPHPPYIHIYIYITILNYLNINEQEVFNQRRYHFYNF